MIGILLFQVFGIMSAIQYFGRYEKIPNLYGETPRATAKNMVEHISHLYQNIWDKGDDDYSYGTWTISENMPESSIAKISSPILRKMIILYNCHDGEKRMMIWHDNGEDLHFYCDEHPSDCKWCCFNAYMGTSITPEEKLELLEAMIPCNPMNHNGWLLDGSNPDCPKYDNKVRYAPPTPSEKEKMKLSEEVKQKFDLQQFNLQIFQLIRRGILQPRACL